MAAAKPLPQLPSSALIPRLTIEASEHLNNLVVHAVQQRGLHASWVLPIQMVLESLATWMSQGEWLKGIYTERRRKRVKEREAILTESKPLPKRSESTQSVTSVASQSTVMVELPGSDDSDVLIRRLFELISKTGTEAASKHLLLTVAAPVYPPETDSPLRAVPIDPACTFHEGAFYLPYFKDTEGVEHGWGGTILCGLDSAPDHNNITVVGGSFAVRGVLSPAMFDALVSVLSIGTFTVLSLGLELVLLRDSGIKLRYPAVPPVASQPAPVPNLPISTRNKRRSRPSKPVSGLWNFLTKTTENIIQRGRTISLDASSRPPKGVDGNQQSDGDITPTASSLKKGASNTFSSLVEDVGRNENLLSTSPGVEFPIPQLLQDIAEKEKRVGTVSLTTADETGLASILGWTGRKEDFLGPESFLRHQSITAIYSEHSYIRQKPASDENETLTFTVCAPARWKTYRYYAKDTADDQILGEMVKRTCGSADQPCVRPECKAKLRDHELRWVHHRTKIIGRVKLGDETEDTCMWASCAVCEATTDKKEIAEGTELLSFGKYLELLIYSPYLAHLSPPLCEHTSDAENSRLSILRHFSYKAHVLTFALVAVPDVFAVRPPRLQILRLDNQALLSMEKEWQSEERDRLRLEITMWWKGVKDHIVHLEDYLESGNTTGTRKKLPAPPPPEAEAEGESTTDASTPKARPTILPRSVSSASQTSQKSQPFQSSASPISDDNFLSVTASTSSVPSAASAPVVLLGNLRHAFQTTEQALYASLNKTPTSSVNDVRRLFLSSAKAASKRLAAWQTKHASGAEEVVGKVYYPEPEWWAPGCHSLPGGSVVVREGEWASVIAFTLSSRDYLNELHNMSVSRDASTTGATAGSDASATSSNILSHVSTFSSVSAISDDVPSAVAVATPATPPPGPSITSFLVNMHALATSRPHTPILDPDDDSIAEQWHEQESWTAQISRKEHPKDPTSLLSLRDVLRNKPSFDSTALSSRFNQIGSSASRLVKGTTAKPTVEVSEPVVDAIVVPQPENTASVVEKLLRDAEENMMKEDANFAESAFNAAPTSIPSTSVGITPQQANNLTVEASDSNATIKASTTTNSLASSNSLSSVPPPVPPKIPPPVPFPSSKLRLDQKSTSDNGEYDKDATPQQTGPGTTTSTMGSLTSHLANAMRYVLSGGQTEAPSSRPGTPNHHPLLAGGLPAIDERPHIKYEWVIGRRLKFSCTVFYARQFDSLRRRCGVDEVLVQSLKRSDNWAAEGGKSKSNFWKTSDNRFIIKTLVNAWNVADLQVLIDLGPSYFRYMDTTAHRPSVLAKLMGFYTVEIKNMETNTVQSKADLLIMENLFFEQNISQTFDLKGIQGRKVKSNTSGSTKRTLFDGEWIEGQKKSLILVHPHSKRVLDEAIRADADFLSRSNIMDYSLLLGVDLQQKQICCGLVDTIGSYTFSKTLEYKAKQNIKKDVTVVPPAEYQERFVKAIDTYFVACPDKWSNPGPEYSLPSTLPSVL